MNWMERQLNSEFLDNGLLLLILILERRMTTLWNQGAFMLSKRFMNLG